MKVQVVVGAQYGSEAKGHVTHRLVKDGVKVGRLVANVRVAGPNAGHTVYDASGKAFALRQIPVGAVEDYGVRPMIAAGSEIEPAVLFDEWDRLRDAGHDFRLVVDEEATLLRESHKYAEGIEDLVGRVGSTGKGIGAARADRIMRKAQRVKDDDAFLDECKMRGITVDNVAEALREDGYDQVVIEGTQGYGLGLHAGHYPQCTSSDTRAIDFLAMAGVNPWASNVAPLEVWAVARVYPIRVAGNSGYLWGETTWEALGLPEEYTTVTKKVRRVGQWDTDLVKSAVLANGGSPTVRLAITMIDQKFKDLAGANSIDALSRGEDKTLWPWIHTVEKECGARVAMVTTGPTSAVWL